MSVLSVLSVLPVLIIGQNHSQLEQIISQRDLAVEDLQDLSDIDEVRNSSMADVVLKVLHEYRLHRQASGMPKQFFRFRNPHPPPPLTAGGDRQDCGQHGISRDEPGRYCLLVHAHLYLKIIFMNTIYLLAQTFKSTRTN